MTKNDSPGAKQFERMQRLPPYVFSLVVNQMMEERRKGEDVIDLGMGNPDLPTPKPIVDKMKEALDNPKNHRYSASRGIKGLRKAICQWYQRRYEVELDPETEAIATIGAKEGLSHLALVTLGPGDVVFAPNPCYPIHSYACVIAGADVRSIPLTDDLDFFEQLKMAAKLTWPLPKMIILNFPHNPTTRVVEPEFFHKVVEFARENKIWLVHDLAYADLVYDGYRAPSLLEVPGAKEVGVEFYSMTKGYSMPGWRVGFCLGNPTLIAALARIKSYLDYGIFQPIQIAAIKALNDCDEEVKQIVDVYKSRRDVLVEGLNRLGWEIEKPKATMFVWAKIPPKWRELGSLEFSLRLLKEAKVAVSPGVGFGGVGEGCVRFALVENEHRIRQGIRGIRKWFEAEGGPGK
ncbi:MAG TPA: aminotransferase class I/II-fold pyridoxal phosphate-dependent enzyme [bacterium]|nr:aminotransferase class I/II-fold pyridoxal phosphate-dependent enzyme [bacterium]